MREQAELNPNQMIVMRTHLRAFCKGWNMAKVHKIRKSQIEEEAMHYIRNKEDFQKRELGKVFEYFDKVVQEVAAEFVGETR